MNDLIERYIYDVTRRLPEASKEEVKKELQANINDMLPEKATEEQIEEVLKSLGNPRILASSYSGKTKTLISNEWMDDYFRVLKIVFIIFGSLSLVFGLIEHITHPESTQVIELIFEVLGKVISETITSLLSGFAVVTIIFALISNYSKKQKDWEPNKLPKVPKQTTAMIKKTSSVANLIASVVFGTLFVFLLINHKLYLGWFTEEGNWTIDALLFNDSIVKMFIPLFVISILSSVVVFIVQIYYGHWNDIVSGIYTAEQTFSALVAMAFMNNKQLLTDEFVINAANLVSITQEKMQEIFSGMAVGISVLIGIGVVADLIVTWLKTIKAKQ